MTNGAFPDNWRNAPPSNQGLFGQTNGAQPYLKPEDIDKQIRVEIDAEGNTNLTVTDQPTLDEEQEDKAFDANLAESPKYAGLLQRLAEDLLDGIKADEDSRSQWEADYNVGLDLLGLKINDQTGSSAESSGLSGSFNSRVKHPILLEAVLKFQALARGELLPADGPCRVRNDGDETPERDQVAQDLEDDVNHWLTTTATEYYPDTDRMLFAEAFAGTTFKKVYYDPIRQRPVSESVETPDLIVSNDVTDMANAVRITHRITMTKDQIRRMMEEKVYRDDGRLQEVQTESTSVEAKTAQIKGIAASPSREQDRPRTIYECYTSLDLSDKRGGLSETAVLDTEIKPLPYKVTIDKDARTVLEIRRNWRKDDELKRKRQRFVKFSFIPGLGFLDLGYMHILGQHAKALTAIERILIDAGMFSNFPGGVKMRGRNDPNQIRPAPGEWIDVETGTATKISDIFMSLPYKGPQAELLQLWQMITDNAKSLAGTVELETGDARTGNAMPVGTIMSMIEQNTHLMTGVHKRNHASQKEEMMLLRELFAEYPESLWQDNPHAKRQWKAEELHDLSLVPASDPNVPARIHRIANAVIVLQLAQTYPTLFRNRDVVTIALKSVGISGVDEIMVSEAEEQASQDGGQAAQTQAMAAMAMGQLNVEQSKVQVAQQKAQQEGQAKLAKVQSDHAIETQRLKQEWQKHLADLNSQAQDRATKELIADIQARTQLLLAGLEAIGQVQSNEPTNEAFRQQGGASQ